MDYQANTKESAATPTEILAALNATSAAWEKFGDKADTEIKAQRERIELLESKAGQPSGRNLVPDLIRKTVADLALTDSFKDFMDKGRDKLNIKLDPVAWLEEKAPVVSDSIGWTDRSMDIRGPGTRSQPWVADLVARFPMAGTSVQVAVETAMTGGAEFQGGGSPALIDGYAKTESAFTFELVDARAQTIAHWTKGSRQAMADVETLQAHLKQRLLYGLRQKLDNAIVGGMVGTPGFEGITKTGNFTAFSPTSPPGTLLDSIRQAIGILEGSDIAPTAVLLNPDDWTAIDTSKTTGSGEYLVAQPRGATPRALWGLPVVTSSELAAGDWIVGDFRSGAELHVRGEGSILVGTDGNDFTKNLLTMLAEMRVAFIVTRPACFIGEVA